MMARVEFFFICKYNKMPNFIYFKIRVITEIVDHWYLK
jgi:hypothetical protein